MMNKQNTMSDIKAIIKPANGTDWVFIDDLRIGAINHKGKFRSNRHLSGAELNAVSVAMRDSGL